MLAVVLVTGRASALALARDSSRLSSACMYSVLLYRAMSVITCQEILFSIQLLPMLHNVQVPNHNIPRFHMIPPLDAHPDGALSKRVVDLLSTGD